MVGEFDWGETGEWCGWRTEDSLHVACFTPIDNFKLEIIY
jgi:hypothetical protein